jgi:hypothetical protein
VRQNNQWLLDAIAPQATAEIIGYGRSYSESQVDNGEKARLAQGIQNIGSNGVLESPIW